MPVSLSQYHSFFSLPLSINCDPNKSLFITPGNSDVRPDPELGSRPIQLEHINEKSCTIHPTSAEDDVPFAFPPTPQTLYLQRNILSRSVGCLAGTTNAVCVRLMRGRLIRPCSSLDNNGSCHACDALGRKISAVRAYTKALLQDFWLFQGKSLIAHVVCKMIRLCLL